MPLHRTLLTSHVYTYSGTCLRWGWVHAINTAIRTYVTIYVRILISFMYVPHSQLSTVSHTIAIIGSLIAVALQLRNKA